MINEPKPNPEATVRDYIRQLRTDYTLGPTSSDLVTRDDLALVAEALLTVIEAREQEDGL